jgi:SRSO17 transposase
VARQYLGSVGKTDNGIVVLGASDLEDGGATRGEDGLSLIGYAR